LIPSPGILYVNANDLPGWARWPRTPPTIPAARASIKASVRFATATIAPDRPTFPALIGIGGPPQSAVIADRIQKGGGRMPAFPNLSATQITALIGYLTQSDKEMPSPTEPAPHMKYRFTGYKRFYDPDGYPAVVPPWGTLERDQPEHRRIMRGSYARRVFPNLQPRE